MYDKKLNNDNDNDNDNNNTNTKYELANKYINILVAYYINIICNSIEIHVIDSCFACIIHPLNITNKLRANIVTIHER